MLRDELPTVESLHDSAHTAGLPDDVTAEINSWIDAHQPAITDAELGELWAPEMERRDGESEAA